MPRMGLAYRGIELAARLLNPVEGFNYVFKVKGVTTSYQLATPAVFGDQWAYWFTIKPANGKNFPYGHDVELDLIPADWESEGDE